MHLAFPDLSKGFLCRFFFLTKVLLQVWKLEFKPLSEFNFFSHVFLNNILITQDILWHRFELVYIL